MNENVAITTVSCCSVESEKCVARSVSQANFSAFKISISSLSDWNSVGSTRSLARVDLLQWARQINKRTYVSSGAVAFFPSKITLFHSCNVFITCVLAQWIELLDEILQLDLELTRAFRTGLRVCAKRGIALT